MFWLRSRYRVQRGHGGSGRRKLHIVSEWRRAHLIHLEQRLLFHLFQRADLPCLLLPGKKDLAISTLANLGDDMELVDAKLGTPPAEKYAFAPTVTLELFRILRGLEIAGLGVPVELGSPFFASSEVS